MGVLESKLLVSAISQLSAISYKHIIYQLTGAILTSFHL